MNRMKILKSYRLCIRITQELHKELGALKKEINVSEYIRMALEELVRLKGKKK